MCCELNAAIDGNSPVEQSEPAAAIWGDFGVILRWFLRRFWGWFWYDFVVIFAAIFMGFGGKVLGEFWEFLVGILGFQSQYWCDFGWFLSDLGVSLGLFLVQLLGGFWGDFAWFWSEFGLFFCLAILGFLKVLKPILGWFGDDFCGDFGVVFGQILRGFGMIFKAI